MRLVLALFAVLSLSAGAAQLPCTITIDAAGNVSGSCSAGSIIPPKPIDQPPNPYTPPPYVPPAAGNVVMQRMCLGGPNNYVYDLQGSQYSNNCRNGISDQYYQPQGTIQSFPIPKTWNDGTTLTSAGFSFASTSFANLAGAQYEVAFSKAPGDFEYYKSPAAAVNLYGQTFYPCGIVYGSDFSVGVSAEFSGISTCKIDSGQWYLNWRVVPGTCPADTGHTCGLTFYVPRG